MNSNFHLERPFSGLPNRLVLVRPDVGQIVRDVERVKLRVFAEKVGLVGFMKVHVPEPFWEDHSGQWAGKQRQGNTVFVASTDPLEQYAVEVVGQRVLIAPPHPCGGVIGPTLSLSSQGSEDLEGLYTLLAKAAVVQTLGGHFKARIGEEGLHWPT